MSNRNVGSIPAAVDNIDLDGDFAPPNQNFTVADANATIGAIGAPQMVAGGGLND